MKNLVCLIVISLVSATAFADASTVPDGSKLLVPSGDGENFTTRVYELPPGVHFLMNENDMNQVLETFERAKLLEEDLDACTGTVCDPYAIEESMLDSFGWGGVIAGGIAAVLAGTLTGFLIAKSTK